MYMFKQRAAEVTDRLRTQELQLAKREKTLDLKDQELLEGQKHLAEVEERFSAELEAQRRIVKLHEERTREAEARAENLLKEMQSIKTAYDTQVR